MGKWTSIVKDLPKVEVAPSRQEQLDIVKKDLPTGKSAQLAELYIKLRAEKDKAEEEVEGINLSIEAVKQLIEEAYEADEITSLKLKSGKAVYVQVEPAPSVADAEAFRLWCLDQGMVREMKLHPSTTKALVKSVLLEKGELPPGIKAFMLTKLVVR